MEEKTRDHVDSYFQTFQILETYTVLPGAGFWGEEPTEGLALPSDVLEKLYYRNAARIYPRIGERLQKLGTPSDRRRRIVKYLWISFLRGYATENDNIKNQLMVCRGSGQRYC